jgi:hypothetical protein
VNGRTPLALLAFLTAAQVVVAQARITNVATDATDPFNLDDSEPSIAVNPTNPLQIVIVAFSENWGTGVSAPIWWSTNGGLTWTKLFIIPEPSAGLAGPNDQKVAFDRAGNLHIAELGVGGGAQDFIFRQTGSITSALVAGATYGDDQPHLDIDRTTGACGNQLYSPWLNTGVSQWRSTVSNSANRGVTMADVGVGNNAAFPNRTSRIALAPNGRAFLIYKTREGGAGVNFENVHFRVARSDDCGVTWAGLGAGGVSVHGASAVVTFFTNQFGNPAKGKVARARSSDAWIAVDPSDGDIYAAYVNRDGTGFGQIFLARSTDNGATWTNTRVSDGTHHSAYPEVAVAANGTVGVLYVDYDDAGPATLFRHRFARSFNNGATWTDQILQTMDPTPLANARNGFLWGDYEGLTAVGNTFYGVFTGASTGRTTPQLDPIFFAESALPASPPAFHRALSLHAGIALPFGSFNTAYDPGPTVNLDVIFPITPRLAFDLRGGVARFNGTGPAPNINVWDVSANLKWMAVVSTPWPFVNGGFGAYKVGSSDWAAGANIGLGVGRPLLPPTFDIELTINYHRAFVPGPDVAYGKVQVGFIRRF